MLVSKYKQFGDRFSHQGTMNARCYRTGQLIKTTECTHVWLQVRGVRVHTVEIKLKVTCAMQPGLNAKIAAIFFYLISTSIKRNRDEIYTCEMHCICALFSPQLTCCPSNLDAVFAKFYYFLLLPCTENFGESSLIQRKLEAIVARQYVWRRREKEEALSG